MADLTAAQVRRDAATRLILMAEGHPSYRGPYDPDRMGAGSIDLLWRWARKVAHDAHCDGSGRHDAECLRVQVVTELLIPVAKGDAGALYDAIAMGGVGPLIGEGQQVVAPTLAELEEVLSNV